MMPRQSNLGSVIESNYLAIIANRINFQVDLEYDASAIASGFGYRMH